MTDVITPQMYAAIAQQTNAVFADPNATSDQVLDAVVSYLTINGIQFHTASGEVAKHLQAGAKALRELELVKQSGAAGRRFLGMPKEPQHGNTTDTGDQGSEGS